MTDDWKLAEKKASVEGAREAALEYARQVHERYMAETSAAQDYALVCLRSLLLLNGGAIVAILTLIGSAVDENPKLQPSSFVPAFQAYFAGLGFVVIASIAGYLSLSLQASTRAAPDLLANNVIRLEETWPLGSNSARGGEARVLALIAIFFGTMSLFTFLVGGYRSAQAFSAF
jgi:hypothetical protein